MNVRLHVALGFVACGLAGGCGSAERDATPPGAAPESASEPPPELVGQFGPTSPGAIVGITFTSDGRYTMLPAGCSGGAACQKSGTFSLDPARTELRMTDAVTGETTTFAFQVTTTDTATSASPKSVRPLDDAPVVSAPDETLVAPQHGSLLRTITGFLSWLGSGSHDYGGTTTNGWLVCPGGTITRSTPYPSTPGPGVDPGCRWTQNP